MAQGSGEAPTGRRGCASDSASAVRRSLKGYVINADPGRTAQGVAAAVREAILAGALRPEDWLREEDLAAALGVSRTPVRAALSQLADEGLVTKTIHRGAVVAGMSVEDVLALYVVREDLEGLAARLAAVRGDSALVTDLDELAGQMRAVRSSAGAPDELAALNLRWHGRLREAAGNVYLDRFLGQVEQTVRRLPVSTFATPSRVDEVLAEHDAVLAALRSRDASAAEAAARDHMRRARAARITDLLGT